jgi:hypothetical protein
VHTCPYADVQVHGKQQAGSMKAGRFHQGLQPRHPSDSTHDGVYNPIGLTLQVWAQALEPRLSWSDTVDTSAPHARRRCGCWAAIRREMCVCMRREMCFGCGYEGKVPEETEGGASPRQHRLAGARGESGRHLPGNAPSGRAGASPSARMAAVLRHISSSLAWKWGMAAHGA